ncbi:tetratricopeptide repeat protein [Paenibacillus agricola]|uniref:Tetratricopeptide repeat protein n=1 Tax=Paenibacillus agricola TaxID=2716264 RepID=A0ABX0JIU6_9BACL|nr:tetratricopeptide repeat protein [Paenibacillus agricola]NHN34389.1 tetratricopeptide repeat protein [Paenibacillus agricola]
METELRTFISRFPQEWVFKYKLFTLFDNEVAQGIRNEDEVWLEKESLCRELLLLAADPECKQYYTNMIKVRYKNLLSQPCSSNKELLDQQQLVYEQLTAISSGRKSKDLLIEILFEQLYLLEERRTELSNTEYSEQRAGFSGKMVDCLLTDTVYRQQLIEAMQKGATFLQPVSDEDLLEHLEALFRRLLEFRSAFDPLYRQSLAQVFYMQSQLDSDIDHQISYYREAVQHAPEETLYINALVELLQNKVTTVPDTAENKVERTAFYRELLTMTKDPVWKRPLIQLLVDREGQLTDRVNGTSKMQRDPIYRELKSIYEELLQLAPEDTRFAFGLIGVLNKLGDNIKRGGDLKKAYEIFEHILTISPEDAAAIYQMGLIHMRNKEWPKAFEILDRVYKRRRGITNPKTVIELSYTYAICCAHLGLITKAVEALNEGVRLDTEREHIKEFTFVELYLDIIQSVTLYSIKETDGDNRLVTAKELEDLISSIDEASNRVLFDYRDPYSAKFYGPFDTFHFMDSAERAHILYAIMRSNRSRTYEQINVECFYSKPKTNSAIKNQISHLRNDNLKSCFSGQEDMKEIVKGDGGYSWRFHGKSYVVTNFEYQQE